MVSIKNGVKLSQMLRGSWGSHDMQCERGPGNARWISGLFMGALGAVEGKEGPATEAACELLPGFYALMNLPLKNRDIRDRIPVSLCTASLSLSSWKT